MPAAEGATPLEDDGLYTPVIKRHSLEKIRIHDYYLDLFSTAMKSRWPQRAYLGLYCGAGRARVEETGEIVETTVMRSFRLRFPFTKHILVDQDPRCIEALQGRIAALPTLPDVTLIQRDVNSATSDIVAAVPRFERGHGLLSFCFVDPFAGDLDFDVIRTLGTRYRMDFLILLMLGRDIRTNFRRYLEDPEDTRIAALVDDPGWREEWLGRRLPHRDLVRFLLEKFDAAMARIGYRQARPDDAQSVRILGRNVFLYSLVFYSKNELGQAFWQTTRAGLSPQLGLEL